MNKITNHMPTAELQALDAAHHMHPFTDNSALAKKGARIMTQGKGVWLTDSEGHRILDGMAGLWCASLGFSERRLADAAHGQMTTLPYYHSFSGKVPGPVAALVEAMIKWAPVPMARKRRPKSAA